MFNFQPPSTASDVFRLASLMVYHITNGKTYIKSHKDAAVITSESHPWLHARYSSNLMGLLGRILSTKPEERPTAEEINAETFKNRRQNKPEILPTASMENFLTTQKKMVALLPKTSYQYKGETYTFDQWNGWLGEDSKGLWKQAGESGAGGGVVNVGESINKLSDLLMRLQDPMTGPDLAKACSLLKNIEQLAHFESNK